MIQPYYSYMFMPFIPPNCDLPPTIYSVLNSIVNGDKEEEDYTKIKDLAKEGRSTIFNFDYPLSSNINKEDFETLILKHYMMRRIGFETVTAFRLALDSKLNEIMPMYNKMFDALENWNIFSDGEVTTREGSENRTGENTNNTKNTLENSSQTDTNNTSDRRNSELPQNQLNEVRDGNYVTNYNYDTDINHGEDSSTSNGESESKGTTKDDNIYREVVTRTPADKIAILKEMQENIKSIYTLIFQDLDVLFFGLI